MPEMVSELKVYVGTSGWAYFWNPDGLDWYVKNSCLNAVELNASFYRFPFKNQVIGWARKSKVSGLRWAVKIHNSITHKRMLSESSLPIWKRFKERFSPLDPYIDFYLVQLPPRFKLSEKSLEKLRSFSKATGLGWRLAVEFRSPEWFREEIINELRILGITFVSVDSPEIIYYSKSGPFTYLRLHGRSAWYSHYYSSEELKKAAKTLIDVGGEAIYAFLNNDHGMLDNGRELLHILTKLI